MFGASLAGVREFRGKVGIDGRFLLRSENKDLRLAPVGRVGEVVVVVGLHHLGDHNLPSRGQGGVVVAKRAEVRRQNGLVAGIHLAVHGDVDEVVLRLLVLAARRKNGSDGTGPDRDHAKS